MRWNLQVRASAAAAPPSAAKPAPSQALAVAGGGPRAGAESSLRPAAAARPRTPRPRSPSPAPAAAGGWNRRAIARALRRAGGGGKWRRAGGTKWRRDPWGWARVAEEGARGPRACACRAEELPSLALLGPRSAKFPRLRGWGWQRRGGGGLPQAHPFLFCLFGLYAPSRLDSAKEVMVAGLFSLKTDRAGRGLGCGESPSPAN